jgi:hypothetical protein
LTTRRSAFFFSAPMAGELAAVAPTADTSAPIISAAATSHATRSPESAPLRIR